MSEGDAGPGMTLRELTPEQTGALVAEDQRDPAGSPGGPGGRTQIHSD